jgi:hypothetical protein
MDIYGTHVHLRPVIEGDLPFLQTLWNDGVAMRHLGYPQGMGVTTVSLQRWWATDPRGHHIITLGEADGAPIGEFAYTQDADGRVRFDVKILGQHQAYGYGTEALTDNDSHSLRAVFREHRRARHAAPVRLLSCPHGEPSGTLAVYARDVCESSGDMRAVAASRATSRQPARCWAKRRYACTSAAKW